MPLPDYAFPPLVPTNPNQIAGDIARVLQVAWDRVEAEKERVLDLVESGAKVRALARLSRLQEAIEGFQGQVDVEAQRFVTLITGQYAAGVETAAVVMGTQPTWNLSHRAVVASLASDTYADLLQRSEDAGRTSAAFARAVRRVAREELPLSATGGRTAQQVGREIRRRLETQHRIGAVTYRDGSVHDVSVYTDMLARTKGRVAYNAGSINGYHEAGVTFMEVFDGSTCGWAFHKDSDRANGTIRTAEECAAQVISHPNCLRSFGPRPDVRSAVEARKAVPLQDLTVESSPATAERAPAAAPAAVAGQSRRDTIAARRAARATA